MPQPGRTVPWSKLEDDIAKRRKERLGIILPVVVILVLVWLGIRRIRR